MFSQSRYAAAHYDSIRVISYYDSPFFPQVLLLSRQDDIMLKNAAGRVRNGQIARFREGDSAQVHACCKDFASRS